MPIDGLYSTASDLGRLGAVLLNDGVVGGIRVLPEGVAAEPLAPRATVPASELQVGLGIMMADWQSRPSLRVAGGGKGYGVLLHLLPQDRVGVIVLTNQTGVALDAVSSFVLRRLLELPEPVRQNTAAAPADSAALTELVDLSRPVPERQRADRLLKDAAGRPYLWLRQRLFGRQEN